MQNPYYQAALRVKAELDAIHALATQHLEAAPLPMPPTPCPYLHLAGVFVDAESRVVDALNRHTAELYSNRDYTLLGQFI